MILEIITLTSMAIGFSFSIYALYSLCKKKPKKDCFGEWGFEGENCELCSDVNECSNCSN